MIFGFFHRKTTSKRGSLFCLRWVDLICFGLGLFLGEVILGDDLGLDGV